MYIPPKKGCFFVGEGGRKREMQYFTDRFERREDKRKLYLIIIILMWRRMRGWWVGMLVGGTSVVT